MCVQRRMKTGGEKGQTEIKLVRKNTAAVLIASGSELKQRKQIWEETPNNQQRLFFSSVLLLKLNNLVRNKATKQELCSYLSWIKSHVTKETDLHYHIILSC